MRLGSIDQLRGFAVVCMVLIHVVNAFLIPDLRSGLGYVISEFFGGIAAPSFLTLAGLSAAVLSRKSGGAQRVCWRGAEILMLAFAFRIFEWAVGGEGAHSNYILRVDVLNCIGASLLLLGVMLSVKIPSTLFAAMGAATFVMTPLVKSARLPNHPLAYYLAHPTMAPFSMFGWTGYALIGCALGLFAKDLNDDLLRKVGRGALAASLILRFSRLQLKLPGTDFDTVFMFERVSLTIGLFAVLPYLTNLHRHIATFFGFLGRHSLLIYCVHVELCYGLLLWGLRDRQGWPGTLGLTLALIGFTSVLGVAIERLLSFAKTWQTRLLQS